MGDVIVHNRARRFRIDGDAVWYSSAIELRIFAGERHRARNAEAMTVKSQTLALAERRITLELSIANGVGARQRMIAERVLQSARPMQRKNGAARRSNLMKAGLGEESGN